MTIEEAIIAAGVAAIKSCVQIYGAEQDDEVPEPFITSLMASQLNIELATFIRIERPYDVIARELKLALPSRSMNEIRALRADIAIYDKERMPTGIIEIKKFTEGTNRASIVADLQKVGDLVVSLGIPTYGGVMICETKSVTLEKRIEALKEALGKKGIVAPSGTQTSQNSEWHWCFACTQLRN